MCFVNFQKNKSSTVLVVKDFNRRNIVLWRYSNKLPLIVSDVENFTTYNAGRTVAVRECDVSSSRNLFSINFIGLYFYDVMDLAWPRKLGILGVLGMVK